MDFRNLGHRVRSDEDPCVDTYLDTDWFDQAYAGRAKVYHNIYLNERVFLRLVIVSDAGLYAIVPYKDRADAGIGMEIRRILGVDAENSEIIFHDEDNSLVLSRDGRSLIPIVDIYSYFHNRMQAHTDGRKRVLDAACVSRLQGILISGSFALSIILFLMCSVMIDWINTSLTTTKSYTPQVSIYRRDYGAVFNQEFAQKIREITGVKNVYGRMHVLADVETNTGIRQIDLISYDALQLEWAKEDLIRGGNIESVKNEIGSVIVVYDQNHIINIGDCYTLNGNELHVAAVISDNPFSTTDSLTVICSEETFKEYVGETEYSVIDIQLEKDAGDDTINSIRAMIDDDLVLSDRRAINLEANSTYYAFSLLVYTFLGILGLIAALNIINSITMSVSSRSRQYGMMRAIGLENHQLKKMILAEAMTLAVVGCFAGCVPGTLLHAWFYKTAISSYYGTEWQFPVIELCIIVALVFGSAMAAVYFPLKRFEKKTITELIG